MRMNLVFDRAAVGVAAICLIVPLASAYAAESDTMIEEIVVTAQKRVESAQDIGISINAFSGDPFEYKS